MVKRVCDGVALYLPSTLRPKLGEIEGVKPMSGRALRAAAHAGSWVEPFAPAARPCSRQLCSGTLNNR